MFCVRNETIIKNKRITNDIYLLKIKNTEPVKDGQFFMVKTLNSDGGLFRPISVFENRNGELGFLYQNRGKMTNEMTHLKKGDHILLHGPHGNGFPEIKNNLCLIGGGIGAAPLYMPALNLKTKLYIGIKSGIYSDEEIENIHNLFHDVHVYIKIGGLITDDIDFKSYETVFACGPVPMMRTVAQKHKNTYVSLERRMGCGIGACLSCSVDIGGKMYTVCKDGPVFKGEDIQWE